MTDGRRGRPFSVLAALTSLPNLLTAVRLALSLQNAALKKAGLAGKSETTILNEIHSVIPQIITYERQARQAWACRKLS